MRPLYCMALPRPLMSLAACDELHTCRGRLHCVGRCIERTAKLLPALQVPHVACRGIRQDEAEFPGAPGPRGWEVEDSTPYPPPGKPGNETMLGGIAM